ncbi:MAG: acyl-ACP--UDP-N-acetylglucosamine O-acyltransferase [Desulfuromonadaceae bacterium]|nr:acyl-ACP--UDP-N-acetylglucosamine O-acyltransferase [Desulfuromonadaceae bacterium]
MIHETAIIQPGARIADNVTIGPFAVIGEHVEIGSGSSVGPHAVIEGRTVIGEHNRIFQFASVGAIPQDLKYRGEETRLVIGDRNQIREFTTIHVGTEGGGGVTKIGNDNLFMAYSHVGHDSKVGNHAIFANCATLGGHVEVQDYAILGGLSGVHQFTRIGCHCMISGGSMVGQDIPPYIIAQGDRAKPIGINIVGLRRRGFSDQAIVSVKEAFRIIFRSGLKRSEAFARIAKEIEQTPELKRFLEFFENSRRGIAR